MKSLLHTRAAVAAFVVVLTSCASDRTASGGASDVYIASGADRIARCSDRLGAAAITSIDCGKPQKLCS